MGKRSSVLIVGNQHRIQSLFASEGFEIIYEANQTRKPDLVCFTGGEDIDPKYYGEEKHPKTRPHPRRDAKELMFFERYLDVAKVGVCRGGQLLNVLSGGSMFQHVDGHLNEHEVIDLLFTKQKIVLPSAHHQMMIPGEDAVVLAVAHETKEYQSMADPLPPLPEYDTEVLWYPRTNSLCYQSHPEYYTSDRTTKHTDYFFDLVNWCFGLPK